MTVAPHLAFHEKFTSMFSLYENRISGIRPEYLCACLLHLILEAAEMMLVINSSWAQLRQLKFAPRTAEHDKEQASLGMQVTTGPNTSPGASNPLGSIEFATRRPAQVLTCRLVLHERDTNQASEAIHPGTVGAINGVSVA